jgi:iron complex outermembrane receptor protein
VLLSLGLQGGLPVNALPARAQAGSASPDGVRPWIVTAAGDTLALTPEILVTAPLTQTTDPDRVLLSESVIESRGAWTVADLGPLLPDTRVSVNSRGETLFMIRGAPERHVRLTLDGIPLVVPWDGRADLSTIPADAIGTVCAVRGVGSVLDEPEALAGTVELLPVELDQDGERTRLSGYLGEAELHEGRLLHQQRRGSWSLVAALARRERRGFLVPGDRNAPFNQSGSRVRTNSDLEQTTLLLHAMHRLRCGGRLRLTFQGMDGSRGVPPETHLAEGARFWRYPLQRRGLLGLALALPLDAAALWNLQASASADLFQQDIRSFDDATYGGPSLAPGVDYEKDRDATGYARLRLTRQLGTTSALAVQGLARATRHRESLVVDGPEEIYSQVLVSLTGELQTRLADAWELQAGAGWESAATPETGDKPGRGAADAAVLQLRLARQITTGLRLQSSLSRRSRFPSLREMFSGALGRFVPNPDLGPERQDLVELGGVASGQRWTFGVSGFASWVADGIEKVVVSTETQQFTRVNVDRLRTLGLEAVATWQPRPGLDLSLQHAVLQARRRVNGAYDGAAEDRPGWLTTLAATWRGTAGPLLRLEFEGLGPRESADVTDVEDGLHRLPAQVRWNLRIGYDLVRPAGWDLGAEISCRLENVFDQRLDSQVGLPEPGRMFLAGVSLWRDRLAR